MASLDEFLKFKTEIDSLNADMVKVDLPLSAEAREELESRVEYMISKMEHFWAEGPAPVPSQPVDSMASFTSEDEPDSPSEVLVKRAGAVGRCEQCGSEKMPCACFSHLPRPQMVFEGSKLVKIAFPEEFNAYDRVNWLKAMKIVVAKRRGGQ